MRDLILQLSKSSIYSTKPVGIIYSGFALSVLWGWFFVPLGVVPITTPWAIGIYCLAGIIRGNRVKIPKEQDMPCTLQLTMIYVGITFFLIVGYICHQIT
ncbi:hypothetical protein VB296_24725 [Enterobacter cloacae]|uniref:hypothetical protein n=1 Tax=Enterobacteriaceae TaxID=543 RepID=UPI002B1F64CF|nr:hypothetical protein [Enterobacter cloacae]MEA5226034.1 hypothetical protein [Enterobacter cloacae]